MEALTVYGANHAGFVVSDLDRTTRFFQELLGFELASRAPRGEKFITGITGITGLQQADIEVAYLRGYGLWIELIRYKSPADRGTALPKIYQDGAGHIAFDVAQIYKAVAAAAEYGLAVVGDIGTVDQGPNQGRKVVYMQSKEGLSIEFIEVPLDQ